MIRQCLNRRIGSFEVLRAEVAAWQAARDRVQAKVDWQFTNGRCPCQAEAPLSDI